MVGLNKHRALPLFPVRFEALRDTALEIIISISSNYPSYYLNSGNMVTSLKRSLI